LIQSKELLKSQSLTDYIFRQTFFIWQTFYSAIDKLTKWAAQPSSVVNQVTVLNDYRETAKQV